LTSAISGPAPPQVLRVAAAWGTTIVGVRILDPGQDCVLGDAPGALAAMPDGLAASPSPLRAVGSGWELDARGAVSGSLVLRGREEDVAALGRTGAGVPVLPGDYGLIQYGLFSVFFQFTAPAAALRSKRRSPLAAPFVALWRLFTRDPLVGLSFFSSIVLHLGLIGLLIVNWTPDEYRLPPELVSAEDYAARFGLKRILPEMLPPAADNKSGGGQGVKDPGAKDPKKQGGGQKIQGKEGKAGMNGKEDHSELPGEIKPVTNYGGLSEALADTGKDIKSTLNQIATVADALGGLNSANVVLGSGPGTGLHGSGAGGGGAGAGVMFGSGTLNTGWGPGSGGGFGSGAGGPGGRGSGGFGSGGNGTGAGGGNGAGSGPGEHGITAASGGGAAHGGLSAEQIRRVVMAHQGALRACYEIEAEKDPNLRGGVTVAWTIDPGGAVTSANLAGTTIRNQRVEGCVLRQVRTWRFPASEGTSQATYPFSFGIGH
jgi:hypothetical protein